MQESPPRRPASEWARAAGDPAWQAHSVTSTISLRVHDPHADRAGGAGPSPAPDPEVTFTDS